MRALLLIALAACADPDESELDEALIATNGVGLNGVGLNGVGLNGTSLTGATLVSVSNSGRSSSGATITAATSGGPPLAGASLVGSTWTGTTSNNVTISLRIDGALAGTGTNAELWFYDVSYQNNTGWQPLCGLDSTGAKIKAVSVAGLWRTTASDSAAYGTSTTAFSLACRAKSIAKCVEWGYKPYRGYTTQMQSCVRMLRGDYCGTGVAYTVDGTTINFYDNLGIQLDAEAWKPEAEWTPTGARCVSSNNSARYDLVLQKDPKCLKAKSSTCGTTFANGAILIDELP